MNGALLVAIDRQGTDLKHPGRGRAYFQLHTRYPGISALKLASSGVRWTEYEAHHPWVRLGTGVPMTNYP